MIESCNEELLQTETTPPAEHPRTPPAAPAVAFRQRVLFCWLCWHRTYPVVCESSEDTAMFRCDRCERMRILDSWDELLTLRALSLGFEPSPSGKSYRDIFPYSLPAAEVSDAFLRALEEEWVERCDCGGVFRLGLRPRCAHCGARGLRWLLRTQGRVAVSRPPRRLRLKLPESFASKLSTAQSTEAAA